MKHVRIKQEKTNITTINVNPNLPEAIKDIFHSLAPGKAFGVDRVDQCKFTGKPRIHLIDDNGFDTFGWVYEEFTEAI